MSDGVTKPFSVRMDDNTHGDLAARAHRTGVSASHLVNRYVREGLRMDEHPGIAFVTAPDAERVAVVAGRPRLKVVDVVATWRAERQNAKAAAQYFGIGEDEVHAVLRYYAAYRDEVEEAIREHLEAQNNYERVIRQRNTRASRRVANA